MQRGNSRTGPGDPLERFAAKVQKSNGCWLWGGSFAKSGYGVFHIKQEGGWKTVSAHRMSYEIEVGPIPPGMTLDHLCMTPACVNPAHLEPCGQGENTRRSPRTLTGANIRKTHCPKGHPYSGENLFYDGGKRRCRECVRAKNRAAQKRRTAAGQAARAHAAASLLT